MKPTTRCRFCGERQSGKVHFVVKWFFNWSGAWSNAVVCDAIDHKDWTQNSVANRSQNG